ncbi:uncharacterized protein LOC125177533 [Hyalella azteca]|uniref:Uncharacterized protein LOC125177533 n=1 Tax=Hyalella azteca TaxID=294128 RepID=A0A979FP79_HYAAZ|nr:uncharacterized protein LOC125177533 [Hyalella azteca]
MRFFMFICCLVCELILFVTAEPRAKNAAIDVDGVTEQSDLKVEDLTTEEEFDRGPVKKIVDVAGQVMTAGADDSTGISDHTTDSTVGKKNVVLLNVDENVYLILTLVPVILVLFGILTIVFQFRLAAAMNLMRRRMEESHELREIHPVLSPEPRSDAGDDNRGSDTDKGNNGSKSKANPNSEEIEDSEANDVTDQTSLKETKKPGPDGKAGATIVSVTSQRDGEAEENVTNGDKEDTTSSNSGDACQVDVSKLEKLDESKEGAAFAGSCDVDNLLKKADTFAVAMENGSPKKAPDSGACAGGLKMVK